jgi:hypothetical protein
MIMWLKSLHLDRHFRFCCSGIYYVAIGNVDAGVAPSDGEKCHHVAIIENEDLVYGCFGVRDGLLWRDRIFGAILCDDQEGGIAGILDGERNNRKTGHDD